MRRKFLFTAFWILICLALPASSQVAELAEGDRLLLDTTQILGTVSGATDKFSVVQQYIAQRTVVTTYLEKQYPGQTVDWSVIPAVMKAK